MKAVLISIRPKWCELIVNGQKTVEVRKTKPKLETPFKCYIYCTKGDSLFDNGDRFYLYTPPHDTTVNANQSVIGEFVCDAIIPCTVDHMKDIANAACLSLPEMWEYAGKASAYDLFGWHISNLKIYTKPVYLGKLKKPYRTIIKAFDNPRIQRPPQSWCYVEEVKIE